MSAPTFRCACIPSGSFTQVSQFDHYGIQARSLLSYQEESSPLRTPAINIEICNPMPTVSANYQITDIIEPTNTDTFLSFNPTIPLIDEPAIDAYAAQLKKLAVKLQEKRYDKLIVPLRGGLKPAMQLDVLCDYQMPILWLPYTAGSQGRLDQQVKECLQSELVIGPDCQPTRLAILDTAIGGHGSEHLAKLIAETATSKCNWKVDFHLLYAQSRYPQLCGQITKQNRLPTVEFNVELWPVEDLLVEDWNEAIGLSVELGSGQQLVIKKCSTEGKFLYRDNQKRIQVIESPELNKYFDVRLGQAISDDILSDPMFVFREEVWKRYLHR